MCVCDPPGHRSASAVVAGALRPRRAAVESDYEQAFALVGARKRAIVLVFTDLLDERAARAMTAAATLLSRRHSVIVVSAGDPEIDGLPDREPDEPLEVYETAVALEVLAARARVVAALSRRLARPWSAHRRRRSSRGGVAPVSARPVRRRSVKWRGTGVTARPSRQTRPQ